MTTVRRITIGLVVTILGAAVVAGVLVHRAGYHAYIIHTGSMTGTYNTGDLVIDRPVTSPIRVGQVITFRHSGLSTDLVTHRVVGLHNGTIQTKGDANQVKDTWNIRPEQVRGVVTACIPQAGYVAYFFKQPAGDAAAVAAVLALILLYGLFFGSDSESTEPESTEPESTEQESTEPELASPFPTNQDFDHRPRPRKPAVLADVVRTVASTPAGQHRVSATR